MTDNMLDCSLLTYIIFACAGLDQASGDSFNTSVYPVARWINNLTVFWDKRTWLEAFNICKSKKMILYEGKTGYIYFDYLLVNSMKQNRSDFEGLWVGVYEQAVSREWLVGSDCSTYGDLPDVNTISMDKALCLFLNASAEMNNNVHAIPCSEEHGYICAQGNAYYKDVPNSYIVHTNYKISYPTLRKTKTIQNTNLEDCIKDMFSSNSVLTEFGNNVSATGRCIIYKHDSHELPMDITMENVTENIITITGSNRPVTYEEDTGSITLSSNVFPCDVTSSTYTEDNYQTTYSTQPYSPCLSVCACPGKTNLTADEIQRILDGIKQELIIDTQVLSSFQRKKNSVPDDRPLSKGLGYTAAIILVLIGSIIILSDLQSFLSK